jgi:hypothetical protein
VSLDSQRKVQRILAEEGQTLRDLHERINGELGIGKKDADPELIALLDEFDPPTEGEAVGT